VSVPGADLIEREMRAHWLFYIDNESDMVADDEHGMPTDIYRLAQLEWLRQRVVDVGSHTQTGETNNTNVAPDTGSSGSQVEAK
jgi:hypothetical protein